MGLERRTDSGARGLEQLALDHALQAIGFGPNRIARPDTVERNQRVVQVTALVVFLRTHDPDVRR